MKRFRLWPYLSLTLQVILITVIFKLVHQYVTTVDIAMFYLLPVLVGATRWGRDAAIYAALISVLALDFFFMPPFLSFTVVDLKYLFTFFMFLLVAVITSNLAMRLKSQAREAVSREARTHALYMLSRELAAITEMEPVLKNIVNSVAMALAGDCWILLPDHNGVLLVRAQSNPDSRPSVGGPELAAAVWAYEHGQPADRGTGVVYYPLRSNNQVLGVIGIRGGPGALSREQRDLMGALAGLGALAIGRVHLAVEANRLTTLEQSDQLRTALFNSVSHELRTPLASITGAATSLLGAKGVYQPEEIKELLQVIKFGADRMNRLVANLLDSARLESGMLHLKRDWCDLQDIVGVVLRQYREILQVQQREVNVTITPVFPLVIGDEGLLEQVLANLLDNAIKYSPEGTPIAISVDAGAEEIRVAVADQGPALPAVKRERIFDKFYRLQRPEVVSGTGLGLSNCKAIIEAHGGAIWVEAGLESGNRFVFTLPVQPQPGIEEGED